MRTPNQGKKKHININKFGGLSRDWVGVIDLFIGFLGVILYGGRKTHKQFPENPGTIPRQVCFCVFSFSGFLSSQLRGKQEKARSQQLQVVLHKEHIVEVLGGSPL